MARRCIGCGERSLQPSNCFESLLLHSWEASLRRQIAPKQLRHVIENSIVRALGQVAFDGIYDLRLEQLLCRPEQAQALLDELRTHSSAETVVPADIMILVRVSNNDGLQSVQRLHFRITLHDEENEAIDAVATTDAGWEQCWERALEPIKVELLQRMQADVSAMDESLSENHPSFMAAMVLLSSEMIGPYSHRITRFLGYSPQFVEVIAARLYESGIWDDDLVRCEAGSDEKKGRTAMILDVLVATGELIRKWSAEKNDYIYCASESRAISNLIC